MRAKQCMFHLPGTLLAAASTGELAAHHQAASGSPAGGRHSMITRAPAENEIAPALWPVRKRPRDVRPAPSPTVESSRPPLRARYANPRLCSCATCKTSCPQMTHQRRRQRPKSPTQSMPATVPRLARAELASRPSTISSLPLHWNRRPPSLAQRTDASDQAACQPRKMF